MDNNVFKIGIYTITSLSGKKYVGMTSDNFKNRWRQHKKLLRRNKHTCFGLQNAFNKYGLDNLNFEIVKSYDKPDNDKDRIKLIEKIKIDEVYYWELYSSQNIKLYNGKPTGTGSVYHTEETKEKIRSSMKQLSFENQSKNKEPYNIECKYCFIAFETISNCAKYCTIRCSQMFWKKKEHMKYKIYPSYDLLKEQYFKTKNINLISEYFGCDKNDIRFLLIQNEIIKSNRKFAKKSLAKTYNYEEKICQKCNTSFKIDEEVIKYSFLKCTDCRGSSNGIKFDYKETPTKELLEKLYLVDGFSTTQIAEKLNCTQPNIYYLLKKFGIKTRSKSGKNRKS